jgi:hypothetical protein
MKTEITPDVLAERGILIREKKAALKKAFDEKYNKLTEMEDTIDAWMLQFMLKNGLENVKTKFGTFFKSMKFRANMADWGAFSAWMVAHDEPELVEKRVSTNNLKVWMKLHNDALPPGITVVQEATVTLRRPTSKGAENTEN